MNKKTLILYIEFSFMKSTKKAFIIFSFVILATNITFAHTNHSTNSQKEYSIFKGQKSRLKAKRLTMKNNIIGKSEESGSRINHMERKFYSQWFSGTYILGYSTSPTSPTASFKNVKVSIKGSKTRLKRGIVYGAVKYGGEWRAARIIKTE
jgi:hypothetical protein